ncbi:GNAT family N-acetyltransferase [Mesorhizobium sp. KR9-304]|uniref:GNAT family N-acetyltransferase n=1 Tax=Mesorhizobium sp. KR9-304 TaxID=3156614 RepID=UPI0032B4828F
MRHILDRPVWNALNTRHASLALGGHLAKRYAPSIHPFASSRDEGPESLAALAAIASPGETLIFLQADEFVLPPGFTQTMTSFGVQMIAERHMPVIEDDRIVPLGEADAADMLELATLTRPGPFTMKAQALGDFWGVRESGRLIAMAGERLKLDGLTELSGVATHPDFQGKGLGRLMTLFAAGKIYAKGEQPFLHTYATNSVAIRLYESIGFKLRTRMNVAAIERQA